MGLPTGHQQSHNRRLLGSLSNPVDPITRMVNQKEPPFKHQKENDWLPTLATGILWVTSFKGWQCDTRCLARLYVFNVFPMEGRPVVRGKGKDSYHPGSGFWRHHRHIGSMIQVPKATGALDFRLGIWTGARMGNQPPSTSPPIRKSVQKTDRKSVF